MTLVSDLSVKRISESLSENRLDVVVTGSIGAVESVRFIRALRRLGADVTAWMSHGAKDFTTPTALSWASAKPVIDSFSGTASHIAEKDACVVAPASASMIAKIANGVTDTPTSALVASYLGQGKPVLLLPNMHESLIQSPMVESNLEKISQWLTVLRPRREEGKAKFPAPEELADHVSHQVQKQLRGTAKVVVTLGPTRAYFDDVRFLSNYSSGKLGSLISEELFRLGFEVVAITGPALDVPRACTLRVPIETHNEMKHALDIHTKEDCAAAVFCAAVLDFEPVEKLSGKTSSKTKNWDVKLRPTEKLISLFADRVPYKVGFKLEPTIDADNAHDFAAEYATRYGLDLVVANGLADVDRSRHRAYIFEAYNRVLNPTALLLSSKEAVALSVASHVDRDVKRTPVQRGD